MANNCYKCQDTLTATKRHTIPIVDENDVETGEFIDLCLICYMNNSKYKKPKKVE